MIWDIVERKPRYTISTTSIITSVRLWKIPDSRKATLAISPDGRTLAAGNDKSMVFLWDIAQLALKDDHTPPPQTQPGCEELWRVIVGADARARYKALWKLASGGD